MAVVAEAFPFVELRMPKTVEMEHRWVLLILRNLQHLPLELAFGFIEDIGFSGFYEQHFYY